MMRRIVTREWLDALAMRLKVDQLDLVEVGIQWCVSAKAKASSEQLSRLCDMQRDFILLRRELDRERTDRTTDNQADNKRAKK